MHHFKPISEFFVDSIGDGADSDNKSLMRVLHEICQRFELSHATYFVSAALIPPIWRSSTVAAGRCPFACGR